MRKGFAPIIVVVAVLVVLVSTVTGAFYLLKAKPKSQSQSVSSQNVSISSNISTQPTFDTSGWSFYKDANYNFSLKYPSVLVPKVEDHGLLIGEQVLFNQIKDGTPKLEAMVYNASLGSSIGEDFDQMYNLAPSSSIEINNKVVGHQKLTKINNRVINSLKAFDYKRNSLPIDQNNPEVGIGTYVSIGGYILILEAGENDKQVVNSVVSTISSQK